MLGLSRLRILAFALASAISAFWRLHVVTCCAKLSVVVGRNGLPLSPEAKTFAVPLYAAVICHSVSNNRNMSEGCVQACTSSYGHVRTCTGLYELVACLLTSS
jgi:hypothetical protein